jgi:ABC-type glycerol-3-phosphate transport system permease component
VACAVFFILFPYVWMISTSFKNEVEIMSNTFTWIPKKIVLKNYLWILGIQAEGVSSTGQSVGLLRYLANSAVLSLGTVVPVAFISTLAGYSISRYRFKGRKIISMLILSTTFFPVVLFLIPWYQLLSIMHLIDNLIGLILTFTALCMPFSLWMMKGYIDTIPAAIEECALVDGCNRLQAFCFVSVPLLGPGLVSVMAYTVVSCWNDFLIPAILTSTMKTKTISVGLTEMLTYFGKTNWGGLMAGSVVTALPVALVFIVLQRQLISGMTAGSVKA